MFDGLCSAGARGLGLNEMTDRSESIAGVMQALGKTSYSRVRDVLRQDIISGALGAGARLKAVELAERYGVSPVPVREALQQLQGEGLVDIEPNRGARVRRIDAKFLIDLFEIRQLLSGLMAAKAAKRMTPALLDELDQRQDTFEEAVATMDVTRIMRANLAFHHVYMVAADNHEAQQLMERHLALIQTLRLRIGISLERAPAMISEHKAILDAFHSGNARAAARAGRYHTIQSHAELIAQLQLRDAVT